MMKIGQRFSLTDFCVFVENQGVKRHGACIVLKIVYQNKGKKIMTEAGLYKLRMKADTKMLREYFSGVSIESLRRRFGCSEKRIRK